MVRKEYISFNFSYQHFEIKSLVVGLNNEMLNSEIINGKWTIKDNIAHLARYQEVFEERIKKIISLQNPKIERYIAENDPDYRSWQIMEIGEIVDKLFAHRHSLIERFENLYGLKDSGCIHPAFGLISIKELFLFFVYHESHHLFTIFKLKKILESESKS